MANGWIEGLTVASIILGTVLGGVLITPAVSAIFLGFDFPFIDTGVDTTPEASILLIAVFGYSFNCYISSSLSVAYTA